MVDLRDGGSAEEERPQVKAMHWRESHYSVDGL